MSRKYKVNYIYKIDQLLSVSCIIFLIYTLYILFSLEMGTRIELIVILCAGSFVLKCIVKYFLHNKLIDLENDI